MALERSEVAVLVVRREEADRVVAPVLAQAAVEQEALVHELVHREQFDGRDSEREQVLDHCRMRDAAVRSAQLRLDVRMAHRQAP